MRKLIALYKAFSGGEWFRASLESIRGHVDGIVVAVSVRAWNPAVTAAGDCIGPLTGFQETYPDVDVRVVHGAWTDQADQYQAGLKTIREAFGPGSMVLVIDTDEVWEPGMLAALRANMERAPREVHYFQCGIRTYLRSPLYQVWPHEPAHVVVGLRNAGEQPANGRFRVDFTVDNVVSLDRVHFHHFSYVRADDAALHAKFANTSGQEETASDPGWWDRVWDELPGGRNLHMTRGHESAWDRIRPVTPAALPPDARRAPVAILAGLAEADRWRDRVRHQLPSVALVPVPTEHDALLYMDELNVLTRRVLLGASVLIDRLKCAVYESLWLAWWARAADMIVEIGSGSGGSMAAMALGSHLSARLVAIDPFTPYDETTHAGTARGVTEGDEAAFWRTADVFGYRYLLSHIQKRSADAADEFADEVADLVLVDGNHTYEIALDDIRSYWPVVEPGGRMVVHDYTTRFPGVIRAVDEWEAETNVPVYVVPGTSLAYMEKS